MSNFRSRFKMNTFDLKMNRSTNSENINFDMNYIDDQKINNIFYNLNNHYTQKCNSFRE